MINVVHVIDSLNIGGAEKTLITIVNNLNKKKYKLYVVTTRSSGNISHLLDPDVYLISLNRKNRFDLKKLYQFSLFLSKNNINIVHSHNHSSSYFVAICKKIFKGTWIHIMHDHHGPILYDKSKKKLDKILLSKLDFYIAVSESLYNYGFRELGIKKENCKLIYNSVTIPNNFSSEIKKNNLIIHLARFSPEKGQIFAISVAHMLKHKNIDFTWYFVGKFNLKDDYFIKCFNLIKELGLEENIKVLGQFEDVTEFLKLGVIGVLTSKYEAMPIALLEYMAWGLPVICTKTGEMEKIITLSGGGFVVDYNDEEKFADSIELLFSNKEKRLIFGQKNKSFALDNFNIIESINRISNIYESLVGSN